MERIGNLLGVASLFAALLLALPAVAQDTSVQVTRGAGGVSETRQAGVLVARGQPAPQRESAQAAAAPTSAFQPVGGERFWLFDGETGALIGCRIAYTSYTGNNSYIACDRRRLDLGLPLRPFSVPAY